jgi:hypothetical protein
MIPYAGSNYTIQVLTSPMIRAIPSPEVSPMMTPNLVENLFFSDIVPPNEALRFQNGPHLPIPISELSQMHDDEIKDIFTALATPLPFNSGSNSIIDGGNASGAGIGGLVMGSSEPVDLQVDPVNQVVVSEATDLGANLDPDGSFYRMQQQHHMLLLNQQLELQKAAMTDMGDAMGDASGSLPNSSSLKTGSTGDIHDMFSQDLEATGGNDARSPPMTPRIHIEGVDYPLDGPDVSLMIEVPDAETGGKKVLYKCSYHGCDKTFTRLYNLKS